MPYTIKQFTVTAVAWTAIVAPQDCNNFSLIESARATAFKIRTDSADATTQDTIAAGYQEAGLGTLQGGQQVQMEGRFTRYKSGETICYVQSSSGTITIIARFL